MRRLAHTRGLVVAVPVGAGLLLGALIVFGISFAQARQARRLDIYGDAPAFRLIDQLGRPVSSDELRGKVVVANFIYTKCPDVCPLLSLRMQALQERLRQEKLLGSHVHLLSFTTDPARDTPAVLKAYAERHRADPSAWRFLTGSEDEVRQLIVKGFLLGVKEVPLSGTASAASHDSPTAKGGHGEGKQAANGYDVMHSTRFVVIDREGRIRAYIDGRELDLDQTMRDLRQLLP